MSGIDLAVVVCVEFDDLLALSLPRLLRHCGHVRIVTSPADKPTQELIRGYGLAGYPVSCLQTGAFYERGAAFNKGAAILRCLESVELHGWIALADADTLWPAEICWEFLEIGNLYTPPRRIVHPAEDFNEATDWAAWPRCEDREFAGYTQIFHAGDPRFRQAAKLYPDNWRHAGGADSLFQDRWPVARKLRPPFEVLHLGTPWANWHGRWEARLDGREIPEAAARCWAQQEMRRARRSYGFALELLEDTDPPAN